MYVCMSIIQVHISIDIIIPKFNSVFTSFQHQGHAMARMNTSTSARLYAWMPWTTAVQTSGVVSTALRPWTAANLNAAASLATTGIQRVSVFQLKRVYVINFDNNSLTTIAVKFNFYSCMIDDISY